MSLTHSAEIAHRCLQAFTQLMPVSQAAFYCIDEHLQARDFELYRMQDDMHRNYLDNYRQIDPLQPSRCLSSGLAVVPLRLVMQGQRRADELRYEGFLQQYGVVDVVEIIASVNHQPQAAISLLRTREYGCFTPEQLTQLQALQGLLEMAVAHLPVKTTSAHDSMAGFTPRERQIAMLLGQGISNKQLARELGIGLPTIKTHLINLFRKAGVSNRTELVSRLFL